MRHASPIDIVVLADSDIPSSATIWRGSSARCSARRGARHVPLSRRRRAAGCGRASRMAIDYHFSPACWSAARSGLARPCFGSTIAMRAQRSGDRRLRGVPRSPRRRSRDRRACVPGLRRCVPPWWSLTRATKRSSAELLAARAALGAHDPRRRPAGLCGLGRHASLSARARRARARADSRRRDRGRARRSACRLVLPLRVDHTLGVRSGRWWLVPVRDLLSFAVFVASFFVGVVSWRGRRYRVRADGTLAPMGESRP